MGNQEDKDNKEKDVIQNKIDKLSQFRKKRSLYLNRITPKYKTRFIQIADEEFEGDYGMLLRELIRTWDGFFVDPNEQLSVKIDIITQEIANLKAQMSELTAKPEGKVLKAASGRIIKTVPE